MEKSIEERAEELYPYPDGWEWHKDEKWAIDPYGAQREAYIQGATEQRAIDIEKACEWLETYMESLGYIDEWCRKGEDDFRKAMEE